MLAAQATVQQKHKKSASESRLDKAKRVCVAEHGASTRPESDNRFVGLQADSVRPRGFATGVATGGADDEDVDHAMHEYIACQRLACERVRDLLGARVSKSARRTRAQGKEKIAQSG